MVSPHSMSREHLSDPSDTFVSSSSCPVSARNTHSCRKYLPILNCPSASHFSIAGISHSPSFPSRNPLPLHITAPFLFDAPSLRAFTLEGCLENAFTAIDTFCPPRVPITPLTFACQVLRCRGSRLWDCLLLGEDRAGGGPAVAVTCGEDCCARVWDLRQPQPREQSHTTAVAKLQGHQGRALWRVASHGSLLVGGCCFFLASPVCVAPSPARSVTLSASGFYPASVMCPLAPHRPPAALTALSSYGTCSSGSLVQAIPWRPMHLAGALPHLCHWLTETSGQQQSLRSRHQGAGRSPSLCLASVPHMRTRLSRQVRTMTAQGDQRLWLCSLCGSWILVGSSWHRLPPLFEASLLTACCRQHTTGSSQPKPQTSDWIRGFKFSREGMVFVVCPDLFGQRLPVHRYSEGDGDPSEGERGRHTTGTGTGGRGGIGWERGPGRGMRGRQTGR